jgi:hypothetical protein
MVLSSEVRLVNVNWGLNQTGEHREEDNGYNWYSTTLRSRGFVNIFFRAEIPRG